MPYTIDDACRYIAVVRWTFAKTMPQWPHEYTVREWNPDHRRDFEALAELIRAVGIVKPWPYDAAVPRYHHSYLEIDGWEYWTMGAPIAETTVINRARVDSGSSDWQPADHRACAPGSLTPEGSISMPVHHRVDR